MVNRHALSGTHIWTTKTGRTTVIESKIATVTHMHASPLLNGVYLMKNVSNLDVIMLHRCSTVSTL